VKSRFALLLILFAFAGRIPAQTNQVGLDVDDVLAAAQQFAQDNLDDDVLAALQSVDHAKVTDFLKHYQDYLQGDYVLDVAQLKDAANTVLPLLNAHEETQPYAAWLRARLDYFDVAQELKSMATNVPPTNAPARPPNPSLAVEEQIWIKKVSPGNWPAAAKNVVPPLKKIFSEQNVPGALVWIAEVESGFDARACSPAGAVGLFQLMPATAEDLGLRLWPFDQRKQLEPSARAAAQYLRQLHAQFGDWRLAVAAYNCGQGRVQRWLQRYKTRDYAVIAPFLPAETQMYVPKVEATILRREGIALNKL
jgi:membrane-bound lytic murein transglycosylase D